MQKGFLLFLYSVITQMHMSSVVLDAMILNHLYVGTRICSSAVVSCYGSYWQVQ